MSKEKQIEEMAKCENCIHANVCVIRGFPSAFENTHWEKEPCDHFAMKTEWISVEERLPEKSGTYLAFTFSGNRMVLDYSERHKLFNSFDCYSTEDANELAIAVTHWMPLLEPPKMKGESNEN